MSPMYAAGELFWYLSGTGSGEHICAYAPSYSRFISKDGTAYGAYGPRLMPQIWDAVDLLRADPGTCRAYMPIYEARDLMAAHPEEKMPDIPCTTGISLIRNHKEQLVFSVHMRSNDIWLGLPYDVYCWTSIGHIIAEALDIPFGQYIHQATSLHVYDHLYMKFLESTDIPEGMTELDTPFRRHPSGISINQIRKAVGLEESMRTSNWSKMTFKDRRELTEVISSEFGVGTILARNLHLCALNFYTLLSKEDKESLLLGEHVLASQLENAEFILHRRVMKNAQNN